MPGDWPLVGRAEELQLIDELARRRSASPGAVLAGAAGVGKTRLAREALAAAAARGVTTRWVVATASARALPLGAFASVVGSVGGDPTQYVHRAAEALLAGAGPRGVVIGVDDAHLLDEMSALLVQQLVLRKAATVVLTLRSGEPAPGAVTSLWKDGHLHRLELQPLSDAEIAALLEAVLGGPLDSPTARRFCVLTEGNALYLRELVDAEREAGRLRAVAGVWRWTGLPALSPGLVELVRSRIGSLSAAERDVVEVLAFGEPLGVPLLGDLTDTGAVEAAESRGLVHVVADGRRLQARLAHPLYGEVQRAGCGPFRARRLRGRIASALAGTGSRRADDVLRRAVLAVDSDLDPDAELLTAAASRAVELLDFTLAAHLAGAAVAAGGGFGARLVLGYALSWAGRGGEADEALADLATIARNDTERAQATLPRVGNLFFTLARPGDAVAVLTAALDTVGDHGARLELLAMSTVLDAWLAQPARAAATAHTVLSDPASSDDAGSFAVWGLVTADGGLGRIDGVAETMQRHLGRGATFTTANVYTGIGAMWLRALRLAGLLDDAERVAEGYRDPVSEASGPAYFLASALLGEIAMHRGRVVSAARLLREAIAGMEGADPGGWDYHLPLMLAPALAMSGDVEGARGALAAAESARHPAFVFLDADLELARAWVAAAEGSVSEAVERAGRAARVAAEQGQPALEVFALHTAVCFGDRTAAPRLAELAGIVDGPRAPAAAAHAAALAADDTDGLLVASAELEATGAVLLAADAAAQAAALHIRLNRSGPARVAAAQAQRLAARCERPATPALRAVIQPLPLSGREREIVMLAAAGLSNRAIADRLVLSVRTVEGHLLRASAKLGVTGRAELAAVIDRL